MIGIISDTHDNVPNILKAVEIFKKRKVDFVIHCGDVVSPGTVRFFDGLNTKFIFGNCDGDRTLIEEKVEEIGGIHLGMNCEINHEGKTIGIVHGDNRTAYEKMTCKGNDYLLHGHRHIPEDTKKGNTRILCPGGHCLGDPKEWNKIIILDVENDAAEFIQVK
jgi:uncharacterized protein